MTKFNQSVARAMIFLVMIAANIWVWWDMLMQCAAWVYRLLSIPPAQ